MTTKECGERAGQFIATKEHRRFTEFAEAVRRHRYIGLCYGPAGVGKTLSARRYTHWNLAGEAIENWDRRPDQEKIDAALAGSRAVFYTPTVLGALRDMRRTLGDLMVRVEICIENHLWGDDEDCLGGKNERRIEMLILDEAERLSMAALEFVRDIFDRTGIGVILIGMPGMEKRLSRYPQLYSRVGFAHHYRPLHSDELTFVLTRHWRRLGLSLDGADFTDSQAIASIARITGGNFRLLHRLFVQIDRILKINGLSVITDDVVEAARSTLVVGI
ncbi:AAA family ATPase [Acidiphilium acidophilum]|uniref:AAA family ATPase n=1 Tax=Acidiphilium acidophilum TaxID=76588 RepID=A0AAW9DKK0_ACIAO|nr:AAA family ATPase [Acidiphilium acidophilum]MDX5929376.1 AAA family ATPase [Acidiphilium acidophilum]GBR73717.1 ATP-binding protein [Acidiphilium acidophilum DSM 700]